MGHLDSNPDLKNDTSMGVIVGEFRILYNSFDDKEAAGKIKQDIRLSDIFLQTRKRTYTSMLLSFFYYPCKDDITCFAILSSIIFVRIS